MSAALMLSGCNTGPSHFRRSVSASNAFEHYRVLPDHQYYYFGRPHAPVAMVAVQDGYRLDAPKWKTIDAGEAELREWVDRMRNQPGSEYNIEPNGAYIFNDSGSTIGVWYSVWRLPVVTFTSETDFSISDPMTVFPFTNKDREREPRLRIP